MPRRSKIEVSAPDFDTNKSDTGAVMKRAQAVKNQREHSTKGVKKALAAFQVTSRDGGPDDLEGILALLVDGTWIQCACFGDRSIC
jgi:hypothetical protein